MDNRNLTVGEDDNIFTVNSAERSLEVSIVGSSTSVGCEGVSFSTDNDSVRTSGFSPSKTSMVSLSWEDWLSSSIRI